MIRCPPRASDVLEQEVHDCGYTAFSRALSDVAALNGSTGSGLASIDNTATPNILNTWFTINLSTGGSAIAMNSDTRH
jgi:hypothetical protein